MRSSRRPCRRAHLQLPAARRRSALAARSWGTTTRRCAASRRTSASQTSPRCGPTTTRRAGSSKPRENCVEQTRAALPAMVAMHVAFRGSHIMHLPLVSRRRTRNERKVKPVQRTRHRLCATPQVFCGAAAAGELELELDLDVFGSLSVTLDDLPKDRPSSSLDAGSDHIVPVLRRAVIGPVTAPISACLRQLVPPCCLAATLPRLQGAAAPACSKLWGLSARFAKGCCGCGLRRPAPVWQLFSYGVNRCVSRATC